MSRWTEEARKAAGERMRALWRDPEFRRTVIEGSRARMKANWQDPSYRRRVADGTSDCTGWNVSITENGVSVSTRKSAGPKSVPVA